MGTLTRVEDGLDEAAVAEWQNGHWMGKVVARELLAHLQTLDHKATTDEVDAYAAQQSQQTRFDAEDHLDDEALKAWRSKQWQGLFVIEDARRFLEGHVRRTGRKASVADINAWIEERSSVSALRDRRDDPDTGPLACENKAHVGELTPEQPQIQYVLYRNEGKLARRCHEKGGDEIREGQFLADSDGKMFCCRTCRNAMNGQADKDGIRLRWYTFASAERRMKASGEAAEREQLRSKAAQRFGRKVTTGRTEYWARRK